MTRRAITPVIAVVLLLMMTVAAAGAAFFWMTTIQSRIQGQIGTQVSTTTTQTGTSLNMFSVIFNASDSGDTINITMQNTGSSTIVNGTVAVTISDALDRVQKVTTTALAGNFDQNQIKTLDVDVESSVMIQNQTYGIKITLPGGVEGTSDCIAQ
jgi:flagellin-like protein